jgi:D-serine deaminase-like pyridoxal phosphate-dependent protein
MARLAADADVKLRPHTKTHLSPYIAKLQIKAGANGICVAKIGEAQAMADEGLDDIMVVHPFYGDQKFKALHQLLAEKPKLKLSLVVDMIEQAQEISKVGAALGKKISVLLKIYTGGGRFGVRAGEEALKMAKSIARLPGIEFAGIKAHENTRGASTPEANEKVARDTAEIVRDVARMLKKEGIPVKNVALGSTPSILGTLRLRSSFPDITEIHPGSYIFGDAQYIHRFWFTEETVALTVLTTVISINQSWAMIDAGYMTFDAYLPAFLQTAYNYDRYGYVKGRADLKLGNLTQEVAILTMTDPAKPLHIGDRLEIIPNHAGLVVNLHSQLYGMRNSTVERVIPTSCREKGN